MHNIIHYQKDPNQNHSEISFQAVRMATIKKSTNNAGEGMEKREPSYTVGGNADTATMENSVEIPLKTGNRTAI